MCSLIQKIRLKFSHIFLDDKFYLLINYTIFRGKYNRKEFHWSFFTGHQRSYGKVIFSVACICHSVHRGMGFLYRALPCSQNSSSSLRSPRESTPFLIQGSLPLPVCTGPHSSPLPQSHVQTFSLWNSYCRQANVRHSTEIWSVFLFCRIVSMRYLYVGSCELNVQITAENWPKSSADR